MQHYLLKNNVNQVSNLTMYFFLKFILKVLVFIGLFFILVFKTSSTFEWSPFACKYLPCIIINFSLSWKCIWVPVTEAWVLQALGFVESLGFEIDTPRALAASFWAIGDEFPCLLPGCSKKSRRRRVCSTAPHVSLPLWGSGCKQWFLAPPPTPAAEQALAMEANPKPLWEPLKLESQASFSHSSPCHCYIQRGLDALYLADHTETCF